MSRIKPVKVACNSIDEVLKLYDKNFNIIAKHLNKNKRLTGFGFILTGVSVLLGYYIHNSDCKYLESRIEALEKKLENKEEQ